MDGIQLIRCVVKVMNRWNADPWGLVLTELGKHVSVISIAMTWSPAAIAKRLLWHDSAKLNVVEHITLWYTVYKSMSLAVLLPP